MPRVFHITIAIVALTAYPPSTALAQVERAKGPFAGLFGGVSTQEQSLDLRGSSSASYQDVLEREVELNQVDPKVLDTTAYASGTASLNYQFQRTSDNSSVALNAHGGVTRYSINPDALPYSYGGSASIGTKLRPRIGFSLAADTSFSPFYSYGFGAGQGQPTFMQGPLPADFSVSTAASKTLNSGATLGINGDLSRRTRLEFSGNWRETRLLDEEDSDVRWLGGQGRLTHQLSRNLGVHAGYGRQISDTLGVGQPHVVSDLIDVGVDYQGSLSLGRRTEVRFGSATSIIKNAGRTDVRLNGNAGIGHGIGETWQVSANYVRDSSFVPGLRGLIFTDSAGGGFGGQLASRIAWSNNAFWTRGSSQFGDARTFTSVAATSGLQIAISRPIGMFVQYTYYQYRVPQDLSTVRFSGRFARQTISAGLNVYVPLIKPERRRRDSR